MTVKTPQLAKMEAKKRRRCQHGWWCRKRRPRRFYKVTFRFSEDTIIICNFCLAMKKTMDSIFSRSILAIEDVTEKA